VDTNMDMHVCGRTPPNALDLLSEWWKLRIRLD